MSDELHDQCANEIACPFCGEADFDAAGLKAHLLDGDCEEFEAIETQSRLMRARSDRPAAQGEKAVKEGGKG